MSIVILGVYLSISAMFAALVCKKLLKRLPEDKVFKLTPAALLLSFLWPVYLVIGLVESCAEDRNGGC